MTPTDINNLLTNLNRSAGAASPDLSDLEKAYLREQLTSRKKYGLIWEDKPGAVEQQLIENLPVLTEVVERRVIVGPQSFAALAPGGVLLDGVADARETDGVLPDGVAHVVVETQPFASHSRQQHHPDGLRPPTNHALIEGDNLHALTVLNYNHAGLVDVIYIDPPYNTGNKDFKYHDAFKDEPEFIDREHKFRHSTRLSLMNKRPRLVKTLLKDTGVIFISIDDNEQAQLKLLCDEVFGEANFVADIVWKKKTHGNNMGHIPPAHDFILVYAKDSILLDVPGISVDDEATSN